MRYTNYLVPNEYSIVILHYETVLRTTTNFLQFYTLPPTLEFLPFFSHLSILTGHFDLPILGIGRWRLGTSTLFWMEATFRARYISSTGPTESKSIAFSEKVVICVKSSWIPGEWWNDTRATTPRHMRVSALPSTGLRKLQDYLILFCELPKGSLFQLPWLFCQMATAQAFGY